MGGAARSGARRRGWAAATEGGAEIGRPLWERNKFGIDFYWGILHQEPLPIRLMSRSDKDQRVTAQQHGKTHGCSTHFDAINVDRGSLGLRNDADPPRTPWAADD